MDDGAEGIYGVFPYLSGDLPDGIHEMVTPCADGYTIYINARLDREHQMKAYHHALQHILNGDFDADNIRSVQEMEADAHGLEDAVECVQEPEPEEIPETETEEEEKEEAGKPEEKKSRSARQLARLQKHLQFLEQNGHDFFAAAERRWLEP